MIIASLLILIATWLNRDDRNMLLLTLLVGWSYCLPVELITDKHTWYATCMTAEAVVLIAALLLKTRMSLVIMIICALLEINHINGLFFNGHSSGSPYHIVVKYLEYIEIVACSLFSLTIINKMKGLICQVWKHLTV